MFIKKSIVLCVVGSAALAACSGENCGDPSRDGFGTALGCTVNPNGYQAQTEALQTQLAERQSIAAELRAENQRLQGQLASLNAEQRQLAGRLVTVNNRLAALDDQLATQLRQQEISQAEYDLAQSQLRAITDRRANVTVEDPASVARVAALENDVDELQRLF